MQTDIDPRSLIGHRAVDRSGQKIGTVDEVYLDDATGAPQWAAVRTGLFGHDALVPLTPSEFADGELKVPYERDRIKGAPDLGAGQHLSPDQEMELYRHYGIAAPTPGGQAQAGQAETGGAQTGEDREFGQVAGGGAAQQQAPQRADQGEAAAGTAAPAASTEEHRFAARPGGVAEDTGTTGRSAAGAGTAARPADASMSGSAPTTELTRHEEQLEIGTERRVVGRARVRRYVVTEDVEETVPVMREKVRVIREPLSADETAKLGEGEIAEAMEEVDLHAEAPVVRKVMRPVERLRLEVEEVPSQETVREQLRKEQFEIEDDSGEAGAGGSGHEPGGGSNRSAR